MLPFQLVRSPVDDDSCVALAPTAFWRARLPMNVSPWELPLVELGGVRSMLPNSRPFSLILFGRSDPAADDSPPLLRIVMNRVTESCATPAVRRPRGPVLSNVWLSDDLRVKSYERL